MVRKITIGLFILTIMVTQLTNAQRKTKEEDMKVITATAVGGEDMTPEQVKQKAINNAKIEALKAAGIAENINSYSDYIRSESDNKMEELFTSDVLSNIRGTVKNIEVLSAKPGFTPEGQMQYTVTINCTVVKYETETDLTFDAWVEGMKMFYKVGEGLVFKVKPTADCYMRAFVFSPKESFVLFPNDYEKSFIMNAQTEYSFPTGLVDYPLDATGAKKEADRLVLVFVKKDIYYTGEVDYKGITDWIMSIPPDERAIKSFGFDVVKQE
jgi:hypothetical protein